MYIIKTFCLSLILIASLSAMEESKDSLTRFFADQSISDLEALEFEIAEQKEIKLQELLNTPICTPLYLIKQAELDQLNLFHSQIDTFMYEYNQKEQAILKREFSEIEQKKDDAPKKRREYNGYVTYADKRETFELMKTKFKLHNVNNNFIICPFPLCSSKVQMKSQGSLLHHLPRFHFKEFIGFDLSYRGFVDHLFNTQKN